MQSEFEPYLKAIAHLYSQQSALYTPTDALLPLEARSVEQQDTQQPQERQVEQFPVLTGLRKYALRKEREHVLLAGRPGSGKSTALKQLAVALAEEGQVPVLVQLKGDRTVPELIQAEFRRAKQRVTLEQIEDWLLADRLILLLDGVNEIPNDDLRRGLAQFREDNLTVPMIFTTRELAVGGDLGIDKRLEMKPLSEPQMQEFVQKYLPEHGEQLLGQLHDRLREIAETPLFLKMLCDVFKQTREIPHNKGELFRQFDRNYERLKKDYAPVSKNFWEFKSEVLQHLAFSMIQADGQKPTDLWLTISKHRAESLLENWLNQRGVVDAPTKAKEWLKDLCNHHLLQDAAKPGEIEFHHQLFQEYYAAEYLLQLLPSLSDEQLKRDYLNYLKWTEAIALMLALVEEEEQALRVVKLAMYDVDLMLGSRLAGEVKPVFQEKTTAWIIQQTLPFLLKTTLLAKTNSKYVVPKLLKVLEHLDVSICKIAAEALGNIGSEMAIPALLKALEHPNSIVFESAVEALSKVADETVIPGLLKALEHPSFPVRRNATQVLERVGGETVKRALLLKVFEDPDCDTRRRSARTLGVIGGEIAIPELLEALNDFDPDIRWIAAQALGDMGSEIAIPGLLKALEDPDPDIRWIAAQALGDMGSEIAIPGLLKALEDPDPDVRWIAAQALGKMGSETAIPELLNALSDPSTHVRKIAASVLGKIQSEAATLGLLKALNDPDAYVRQTVAEAVGEIGDEIAIPVLLKALTDPDTQVRKIATGILGKVGSTAAIPGLLQALKHPNSSVHRSAGEALARIGGEKVLVAFQSLLECSDSFVRERAVRALAMMRDNAVVPVLLSALKDSDASVRKIVVEALGNIGSRTAVSGLLERLEDSDFNVRLKAVEALGRIGSETTITGLLKSLQDSDSNVRRRAAEALGKVRSTKGVPELLKTLEDSNFNVRLEAMEALGEIGSETAIPGLLKALKSPNTSVRESAVKALGKIGSETAIPELLTALEDSSSNVRGSVAEALGKIGSEAVIPKLREALEDPDSLVRWRVCKALEQIGSSLPTAKLWQLHRQQPTYYLGEAIATIQNRCKYYNHEIAHGLIAQGQAIALFFSYASKDEALQNELAKHLNLLERQGVITSWDSRQILPGDEREQIISQQLNTADIILLLISSDSIADNTCYDLEIRRAMERHQTGEAHVIPILLRSVDWTGAPFSQLPVLPKNKQPVTTWDNRDEALRQIAEGIRAVAIELRRKNGIKGA